ncbi:uncharacterized protein [Brachyistius frenatus]|uniref:uncharacterized protein n=1 Tax=Brachyistius frenatus TaxID=100188 RepID=UPI0037E9838C
MEYSSMQPHEENKTLSDACTFSTPAPTGGSCRGKAKPRFSNFSSALMPILKFSNVGSKCPSPEAFKHGNNPLLTVPQTGCFASSSHTGRVLSGMDAHVSWLHDEKLPDITLFDDSMMEMTRNDSAFPDSEPATPKIEGNTFQPTQLSSSTDLNSPVPISCPQNMTHDSSQSKISITKENEEKSEATNQASSCDVKDLTFQSHSLNKSKGNSTLQEAVATTFQLQNNNFDCKPPTKQNDTIALSETSDCHQSTVGKPSPPQVCKAITGTKQNNPELHPPAPSKLVGTAARMDRNAKMVETPERKNASVYRLDDIHFQEITLLEVTRDSELSPVGQSSMEITQGSPPLDSLKNSRTLAELSGQFVAELGRLHMNQSEELSCKIVQPDRHGGGNVIKASLEVTQNITMDSVLENSGSSSEPSGQTVEKFQTSAEERTEPAYITLDITSSSDMSAQSAQLCASAMDCNTSSKAVPSELHGEPADTPVTVEAGNEELLTSHDTESTRRVSQSSPKTAGAAKSTLTIVQSSNLSASSDLNSTAPTSSPRDKTQDLPTSNEKSLNVAREITDQANSVTTETSLTMNPNCSAVNESNSHVVQNTTFDRHSLQKSSGDTLLEETPTNPLLNTFNCKAPFKNNGTLTLSEMSSSDSHLVTLDKPSSPQVCNLTTSLKDNTPEVHPADLSKQNTATDLSGEVVKTPEANPVSEVASGSGRRQTEDHSQSGFPMRDGLSNSLNHQSMNSENIKENTFNLDDTLDLRPDSLFTSTPMLSCKIFTVEREKGKTLGAQKKLYGDGARKAAGQVPSGIPSNLVSDRKTFLTQPAVKSHLPTSKATFQLLKYKQAFALPGPTSGLPMTRRRTQAEAVRNAASSDAPRTATGISSTDNLLTAGSKPLNSGLRRLSGVPPSVQRVAPGLRLLPARTSTLTSSSDKLCGPAAANPVTKTAQAKKHPLARGEALPLLKRKKMDAVVPSVNAETSTSACDATNRARNLKQPTTTQRALPAKTQRDDAAVPASSAESSTLCDAASRARALKPHGGSHRALPAKPQGHGCANCVVFERHLKVKTEEIKRLNEGCGMLEEQLRVKSEEIRRLKEELLKYSKQDEEC